MLGVDETADQRKTSTDTAPPPGGSAHPAGYPIIEGTDSVAELSWRHTEATPADRCTGTTRCSWPQGTGTCQDQGRRDRRARPVAARDLARRQGFTLWELVAAGRFRAAWTIRARRAR